MTRIDQLKELLLEKRSQLINQLDHLQQSKLSDPKSKIRDYILKKRQQLIKIDQTLSLLHQKKAQKINQNTSENTSLN